MTQQIINVGSAINDGTGDPVRTAFAKCNDNFTELYARGSVTVPQGRLTLQTATPVMTTTQVAKTTIFYTPYVGNKVPVYDGTNMVMTTFAELSVATTDTTKSPAALGASKVNDWFVWNDAGTVRLGHGPDWTSDTARSAGTALVMVNGVYLNNASISNGPAAQRGTYVGTTRSNASSQLDWIFGGIAANGVAAFFGIWNAYNRTLVTSMVRDSTTSWTLASNNIRTSNGSVTSRASFVCGLEEDGFHAMFNLVGRPGSGGQIGVGIGYDSITAMSGIMGMANDATNVAPTIGSHDTTALGFHYFQAMEASQISGSALFIGNNGSPTFTQSGLRFQGMM